MNKKIYTKSEQDDSNESTQRLLLKGCRSCLGCLGAIFIFSLLGSFFFSPLKAIVGLPLAFIGMLFDSPSSFKLPYNAIDFYRIAYINNQFVMYGIDYEHSGLKQLVIFNSVNGKKWNKSQISINDDNLNRTISVDGTFNYFNGKCYLIGATVQPLVANDCVHWKTQPINRVERNIDTYLYKAHSSVIANGAFYVGGDDGVYKTVNGEFWVKESMPYPMESKPHNFENSFFSMAVGNNKLITETNWRHNEKRLGLIYTKDLITHQWSYEVYPVAINNIIRGKDRFVGMTESSAVVLVDGSSEWGKYSVKDVPVDLSYGLGGKFIGIGLLDISDDGVYWKTMILSDKSMWLANHLACSSTLCLAAGAEYHLVYTYNGYKWFKIEFNHKHSKPHWWRRFINF